MHPLPGAVRATEQLEARLLRAYLPCRDVPEEKRRALAVLRLWRCCFGKEDKVLRQLITLDFLLQLLDTTSCGSGVDVKMTSFHVMQLNKSMPQAQRVRGSMLDGARFGEL